MYARPSQAGNIANERLVKHLDEYGYAPPSTLLYFSLLRVVKALFHQLPH
jgi:hypothetical protein